MSTPTAPLARRGTDGLAVIGRTLHDLRGIRFDEGELGGTPPAPPAAPAAPPAAPVAPPAPPAATAPPAPPAPPVNVQGDPDGYIRSLREESKERRIALEQAQTQLQEKEQALTSTTSERDHLRRENAVIRVAGSLQANADLLLDSASFQKDLASVDPSDTEAVKAAITAAIEKNAAFKTGPALPPSSGGGHQGGQPSATPLTLDGAVKKALGG